MTTRVDEKELSETEHKDALDILEDISEREEPVELTEASSAQAAQRRYTRIAYYSVALCVVIVILFAWLSSYYVISLQTQFSETTSGTMERFDSRIAKLESEFRPSAPEPKFVEFVVPASAPRLGSPDAKVTVVEFADFQCPFCGKFHDTVFSLLKKEYIDTGKVSFVYQDFAFLGKESDIAAQAAKCAGQQGKFWEYADYLFSHQAGENEGAFVSKNLKSFARTVQLNVQQFAVCLDSGTFAQAVDDETASGRKIGVSGTPTVLVNGKVLVGALPYTDFKQAIDEALAE